MAFELAVYGFAAGILHQVLPAKKWSVYLSLVLSMIAGRLVWGLAMFVCVGFDTGKFGLSAFVASAFVNAIPGIILQLIVIPIIVMVLSKEAKRER